NSLILSPRATGLELLEYGSFDASIAEGTCSGCTASEEPTIKLATQGNVQSLEMVFSAATGTYTIDKATGSEFNAVQMIASCWIKTSAEGVKFHVRLNGANLGGLSKDVSA